MDYMKHLTYFENQTHAIGKLSTPQVTYIKNVNNANYPNGIVLYFDKKLGDYCEVKTDSNGDPVLEGPLVPGYVDLGLSVMWAECNLGADSPEEDGLYYRFKDPIGYTPNQTTIFSTSNPNGQTGWLLSEDPIFLESTLQNKEIVSPKIPTASQFEELINNTTLSYQSINNKLCIKFTAENGNSIMFPYSGYMSETGLTHQGLFYYWSSSVVPDANIESDFGKAFFGQPHESLTSIDQNTRYGLQLRGVCDYPPIYTLLQYDTPLSIPAGETILAISYDDIASSIIKAYTSQEVTISGFDDIAEQTIYNQFILKSNENYQELKLTEYEFNQHRGKLTTLLPVNRPSKWCYIKIQCINSTEIELCRWDTSVYVSGFDRTALIKPNESLSLVANTANVLFRFKYTDFDGYDLTIKWTGNGTVIPYISDVCEYSLTTTSSNLVLRPAPSIARRSSYTVDSTTLATWASRVDADGYLYVRFSATTAGKLTFKTEKPAPVDPEIIANE